MRGVGWNDWVIDRPLKRGEAKRLIMNALRDGPKTASDLATIVQYAGRTSVGMPRTIALISRYAGLGHCAGCGAGGVFVVGYMNVKLFRRTQ